MPVPNYFAPRRKQVSIAKITDGMSPEAIRVEVEAGARFVAFDYIISAGLVSLRRNSKLKFVRAGQSRIWRGLPYTFISLCLGWWAVPWGLVYTPQVIYRNLAGGTDMTGRVLAVLDSTAGHPPKPLQE